MAKQDIFIARQPLVNTAKEVVGYELLYRAGQYDVAHISDHDQASAQVIVNAFLNIGIDHLVGSSLAFINVPEPLLLNDALLPMFQEHSVLELLETVTARPEVLEALQRLKKRGFLIALDDFTVTAETEPLLRFADYVKLDVLEHGSPELKTQVQLLSKYPVKIVAEKVESRDKYEECRALGITLFQGYFFCRPQTLTQKTLPANRASVLHLLQQISDPNLEVSKLQATLSTDAALSYKLLRYVNSAAFGLRREIESLKDAIVLVGLVTIRNWATLILLNNASDGNPLELMRTAMIRARMCENLAAKINPAVKPQMFITGLLSLLDAIMDAPMESLLDNLALTAPIRFAILDHEGPHGDILKHVVNYERGDWDALLSTGQERDVFVDAYLEAVEWADRNFDKVAK